MGEDGEAVQAPFGGGGQVGLNDGEVGDAGQGAPASAGGALLDLRGADVAFTLVVREGHGKIDHEPQDDVLVVAEPLREVSASLASGPARAVLSLIPAVVAPR